MPALERSSRPAPRGGGRPARPRRARTLALGDRAAAAAAYDRLDRDFPRFPAGRRRPARASSPSPASCRARTRRGAGSRSCLERGMRSWPRGAPQTRSRRCGRCPSRACDPAEADLARVRLGRARSWRRAAPGRPRAASQQVASGLAARRRGRVPAGARPGAAPRSRRALRGRGRPLPGHARGPRRRCSPSRTTTRRTPATTRRCPTSGACVAEYPRRPLRRARGVARRAGGDYRAGRFEGAAQLFETTARLRPPSGSTAGFLYWAARSRLALGQGDRARALFDGDGAALQAHLPRRARERGAGPAGGRPAPRPCSWPRRRPPEAPSPSRTRSRVRQLLLIDRLDEAAGGAAPAARVAARAGHPRVDRLAAGPLSPRDHRHEARLPRVGQRGRRPPARRGLADPLPARLRRELRLRRAGGGPRPGPRGGAHLPGVDLRRGRRQPRRARAG